jgi:hypothetical protein
MHQYPKRMGLWCAFRGKKSLYMMTFCHPADLFGRACFSNKLLTCAFVNFEEQRVVSIAQAWQELVIYGDFLPRASPKTLKYSKLDA